MREAWQSRPERRPAVSQRSTLMKSPGSRGAGMRAVVVEWEGEPGSREGSGVGLLRRTYIWLRNAGGPAVRKMRTEGTDCVGLAAAGGLSKSAVCCFFDG